MTPSLTLRSISKTFDGFKALSDASFVAHRGEVHALLGENGAGKSSLMNVVAGIYLPDAGSMLLDGRETFIENPLAARKHGIGMVHQHYKLVRSFNAVENILLAHRKGGYRQGSKALRTRIRDRCADLGFTLDLQKPVGDLSIAEQQRVEILKVLVDGAGIVILDEPTAVLTDQEGEALLKVMRRLADEGSTVVLVTHKLREVFGFADRVTVMRQGQTLATLSPSDTSHSELTKLVVGTTVTQERKPAIDVGCDFVTIQDLEGVRADGHVTLKDASFVLKKGEIYGLAGVGGNGQTEIADILMGIAKARAGTVVINDGDDPVPQNSPSQGRLNCASIPADRQRYAVAGDLSITDNYCIKGVLQNRYGGWLRVDYSRARSDAEAAITAFDILGVRRLSQKASLLSGGNAQKLVIAREFATPPDMVVAHSPSRGLDIRATSDIYRLLRSARDAGAAVLLISEDLDEVMLLSDRIGVLNRGRVVAEFDMPAPREALGAAMVHHD